jgi:hypothetical protein
VGKMKELCKERRKKGEEWRAKFPSPGGYAKFEAWPSSIHYLAYTIALLRHVETSLACGYKSYCLVGDFLRPEIDYPNRYFRSLPRLFLGKCTAVTIPRCRVHKKKDCKNRHEGCEMWIHRHNLLYNFTSQWINIWFELYLKFDHNPNLT